MIDEAQLQSLSSRGAGVAVWAEAEAKDKYLGCMNLSFNDLNIHETLTRDSSVGDGGQTGLNGDETLPEGGDPSIKPPRRLTAHTNRQFSPSALTLNGSCG